MVRRSCTRWYRASVGRRRHAREVTGRLVGTFGARGAGAGDDHATHEPPLWLLQTGQCGDDVQGLALGEALGRPFTVKPARDADSLVPPWPAVVISAGRHGEAAVCKLRRRAGTAPSASSTSAARTTPAREFDLVVTTPDYRVPPAPNVLEIPLPLHRVTPARLAEGRRRRGPS